MGDSKRDKDVWNHRLDSVEEGGGDGGRRAEQTYENNIGSIFNITIISDKALCIICF